MDEMKSLIKAAQEGDADAHRRVALWVFNEYKHRVEWLYSRDPAISPDDLLMTFFEGVMKGVLIADHRGNPLYHIGQRGVWAVTSELRSMQTALKHRALKPVTYEDGEEVDPLNEWVDDTQATGPETVVDRLAAQDRVRIVTTARLRPRERQAVDLIASGQVDPTQPGFNKALAAEMGVSPQRTSQLMGDLETLVHRAEAGYADR